MNNKIKNVLKQLVNAVLEEAEQNEDFSRKLEQILSGEETTTERKTRAGKESGTRRAANRRDPAVLDPIAMLSEDEGLLLEKLYGLTEKELKDIIADYGMDPSRLAMKWKDRERLVNHIVDAAKRRASKGDAFREKAGDEQGAEDCPE
ncbi:MAG: hypothetical protein K2N63_07415 [Lachnospiraceae bacterium]|nr:hypothetical protein [Lachnospiraceae bacterium]